MAIRVLPFRVLEISVNRPYEIKQRKNGNGTSDLTFYVLKLTSGVSNLLLGSSLCRKEHRVGINGLNNTS